MASPKLTARIQGFADKLSGVSRVDNSARNAANAAKPVKRFQSSLPNQQVYGVPGVSQRNQLPKQLQ